MPQLPEDEQRVMLALPVVLPTRVKLLPLKVVETAVALELLET